MFLVFITQIMRKQQMRLDMFSVDLQLVCQLDTTLLQNHYMVNQRIISIINRLQLLLLDMRQEILIILILKMQVEVLNQMVIGILHLKFLTSCIQQVIFIGIFMLLKVIIQQVSIRILTQIWKIKLMMMKSTQMLQQVSDGTKIISNFLLRYSIQSMMDISLKHQSSWTHQILMHLHFLNKMLIQDMNMELKHTDNFNFQINYPWVYLQVI